MESDILLDSVEALLAVDSGGQIRLWNATDANLLGYAPVEVIGRQVDDILPSLAAALAARHDDGGERLLRLDVNSKSGMPLPVTVSMTRVTGGAGQHWTLIRLHRSSSKRADDPQQEFDLSEKLAAVEAFGAYESGLPSPCFAVTADRRIVGWSDACAEFFGVPRVMALGREFTEAIDNLAPADRVAQDIEAAHMGIATEKRPAQFSESPRSTRDLLLNIFPLRYSGGKIVGVVIAVEDVTVRRDAEQVIAEAAVLYREIFMQTPVVKMLFDAVTFDILDANPAACEFYGYTLAEMTRLNVADLSEDTAAETEIMSRGRTQAEAAESFLTVHRRRTGERRELQIHPTYLDVLGRELAHTMIIDVTESRRAAIALRESEQRLRTLVTNAPVILFAVNTEGVFTVCEGRGLDLLGLKPGDRVGVNMRDVYAHNLSLLVSLDSALAGEASRERLKLRERWFDVSYEPLRDASGSVTGAIGVAMDITDEVVAAEALRRANTILSAQLESSLDGVVVVDDSGQIAIYNRRLCELWDIPEQWLATGDRPRVIQRIAEQVGEPEKMLEDVKRLYAEPASRDRTELKTSDGRTIERYTSPVVSREGVWYGRIWFYRDISLQKQTEQELERRVEERTSEVAEARDMLKMAYDDTIAGWSHAMDLRDRETEGHSQRVSELCLRLAEMVGVDRGQREQMHRGALLHDIGKMGIPDEILHKPGPLTDEEWVIMRMHPVYAYQMLSRIAFLRPALDIPYCHHEKWDGTGYPRGLAGEEIPLAARIFAVADVWDALRSDRPYRPAWPAKRVFDHICALSGSHFDPKVVEMFVKLDPLDTL